MLAAGTGANSTVLWAVVTGTNGLFICSPSPGFGDVAGGPALAPGSLITPAKAGAGASETELSGIEALGVATGGNAAPTVAATALDDGALKTLVGDGILGAC